MNNAKPFHIFEYAKELLARGWCKGQEKIVHKSFDLPVSYDSPFHSQSYSQIERFVQPDITEYCLTGAILESLVGHKVVKESAPYYKGFNCYKYVVVDRSMYDEVATCIGKVKDEFLAGRQLFVFNDRFETTHEDVLGVMDKLIECASMRGWVRESAKERSKAAEEEAKSAEINGKEILEKIMENKSLQKEVMEELETEE